MSLIIADNVTKNYWMGEVSVRAQALLNSSMLVFRRVYGEYGAFD